MATVEDRILKYLSEHPEGADDDELASALNLSVRQHANQACRCLEAKGLITRIKLPGKKIRSYLQGDGAGNVGDSGPVLTEDPDEAWFWEGNVQAKIVDFLKSTGWTIDHVCDITARERGMDILASQSEDKLGIEVKGFPSKYYQRGTKKSQPKPTPPNLQAKHWFANALLTVILRQIEMPDIKIALGFPSVPIYVCLLEKLQKHLSNLEITAYIVEESGKVTSFPCDDRKTRRC